MVQYNIILLKMSPKFNKLYSGKVAGHIFWGIIANLNCFVFFIDFSTNSFNEYILIFSNGFRFK